MDTATTADGTILAYTSYGVGEPLLLLSGQGFDHHMWDHLIPSLQTHFRIIVCDYRGTGASSKPQAPAYSTSLFAKDAISILDAVGVQKAHILGYSMGGRVAQQFATKYPHRLGCLILAATTPGNKHGVPRTPEISSLLRSGNMSAISSLMYTQAWIDNGNPIFKPKPIPAFAQRMHFAASEAHDVWEQLTDIHAPTLILHGAEDQINPTANAHLLAQQIPHTSTIIIANGKHGFLEEFADECLQAVTTFLQAHLLFDFSQSTG